MSPQPRLQPRRVGENPVKDFRELHPPGHLVAFAAAAWHMDLGRFYLPPLAEEIEYNVRRVVRRYPRRNSIVFEGKPKTGS